ncbi:tripartite tricarboxylate transporter TctB family protein [Neobacillus niacini]|uniref:tripartite tricarboxylate transporter TctB family protein n=1 Tax=Neobacillus niacini TaxID=86668 RepID=UPI002FFE664C
MKRVGLGFFLAVFILIISGIMFWQALPMGYYSEYGPGPGFLPLWINGILIILAVLYLFITLMKSDIALSKVFPKGEGFINVLVSMGAPILFLILIPYTGFVIASMITLFILFIRGFKWYWSLGYSVGLSILLFLVFSTLLRVPLPVNVLGW